MRHLKHVIYDAAITECVLLLNPKRALTSMYVSVNKGIMENIVKVKYAQELLYPVLIQTVTASGQ